MTQKPTKNKEEFEKIVRTQLTVIIQLFSDTFDDEKLNQIDHFYIHSGVVSALIGALLQMCEHYKIEEHSYGAVYEEEGFRKYMHEMIDYVIKETLTEGE